LFIFKYTYNTYILRFLVWGMMHHTLITNSYQTTTLSTLKRRLAERRRIGI